MNTHILDIQIVNKKSVLIFGNLGNYSLTENIHTQKKPQKYYIGW